MKDLKSILQDWSTLNDGISSLTEEECVKLLKLEKEGEKRFSHLIRIYGRMNKLRTQRERMELVVGAK